MNDCEHNSLEITFVRIEYINYDECEAIFHDICSECGKDISGLYSIHYKSDY